MVTVVGVVLGGAGASAWAAAGVGAACTRVRADPTLGAVLAVVEVVSRQRVVGEEPLVGRDELVEQIVLRHGVPFGVVRRLSLGWLTPRAIGPWRGVTPYPHHRPLGTGVGGGV